MADYQKPQVRFMNRGQSWNRAVDEIGQDKWCYLKNIRSYVDGTMTSRPGLTSFVTLGTGTDYYTSISRLNNDNLPLFGGNWTSVFVLGLTQKLFVGANSANLTNATANPVFTPLTPSGSGLTAAFSGNPLSVVDMAPVGTGISFKYIGDSFQNVSVGYYPGDNPSLATTMARCITMGILPPVTQTVPVTAGAGNLNGQYQWRFVFRRPVTGAQSNPSAVTRVTVANPALTLTNQQASFTLPTTPVDPQTGAADTHVVVDVYRFGGTVFRWKLVGTGTSGGSFTDNLADLSILSAQEPSQSVNPITGISHFNLIQPFIVADVSHSGTGVVSQNAAGKWILTWSTGDQFAPGWLPGSTITINNTPAFTIFQVISATVLELTEDATRVGAGTFSFNVPTGTLKMGVPLTHLWGPWGTGQTGSYIFGCGHPLAPGTLFWTNGNDPDSSDTYNSLLVTDPSENLVNGCVYAGNVYVWSTERMFQVIPSLTVPGQFTVQEVTGGRGIWMEFSLTVQTSGFADLSITWRGKDGIYDFSLNSGLRSLSATDMYSLFPHDNEPGTALATIFPFLPNNIEPVPVPDDVNNKIFQRCTWFDGYLFYDYRGVISATTDTATLVWDNRVSGWVSVDIYALNAPICRGPEIAGNNLKIGIQNVLYDYVGTSDNGAVIPSRVVSRADDFGDGRNQKQLGDLMLDLNPASITVSPVLRTAYHNTTTALATSAAAARTQLIEDFSSGGGIYSITAGIDITWSASASGTPVLYQYELAYLVKPELTVARATDWDDDGYQGAKFFQGAIVQVNTFGASPVLTIQFDGQTLAQTFTVTSSGELEIPLAFNPTFVAHQVRIQSNIALALMGPFKIRWIWEPAPELAPSWITQGTSFGMRGYYQHRDFMPAIQSTDVVTFTITPDNRAAFTYTFASTGGLLLKPYTSLAPAKARIGQYQVTSPTPFRLFQKDTELRVRAWGDTGPWQVVRPFGDLSMEKGARI